MANLELLRELQKQALQLTATVEAAIEAAETERDLFQDSLSLSLLNEPAVQQDGGSETEIVESSEDEPTAAEPLAIQPTAFRGKGARQAIYQIRQAPDCAVAAECFRCFGGDLHACEFAMHVELMDRIAKRIELAPASEEVQRLLLVKRGMEQPLLQHARDDIWTQFSGAGFQDASQALSYESHGIALMQFDWPDIMQHALEAYGDTPQECSSDGHERAQQPAAWNARMLLHQRMLENTPIGDFIQHAAAPFCPIMSFVPRPRQGSKPMYHKVSGLVAFYCVAGEEGTVFAHAVPKQTSTSSWPDASGQKLSSDTSRLAFDPDCYSVKLRFKQGLIYILATDTQVVFEPSNKNLVLCYSAQDLESASQIRLQAVFGGFVALISSQGATKADGTIDNSQKRTRVLERSFRPFKASWLSGDKQIPCPSTFLDETIIRRNKADSAISVKETTRALMNFKLGGRPVFKSWLENKEFGRAASWLIACGVDQDKVNCAFPFLAREAEILRLEEPLDGSAVADVEEMEAAAEAQQENKRALSGEVSLPKKKKARVTCCRIECEGSLGSLPLLKLMGVCSSECADIIAQRQLNNS